MYTNQPRTVYCTTEEQARTLSTNDRDSRALVTGPGTLSFHRLLAEHGSGEFRSLYVAPGLRGQFSSPCGGIVEEAN